MFEFLDIRLDANRIYEVDTNSETVTGLQMITASVLVNNDIHVNDGHVIQGLCCGVGNRGLGITKRTHKFIFSVLSGLLVTKRCG
jgi:hypothetical protein